MHTDNLRKPHREILQIVSGMQALMRIPSSVDAAVSDKLRKALVELSARVTVHLAAEDQVVYPRLIKDTDQKISTIAKQFADEMGGIGDVFKAYLSHGRNAAAIAADVRTFAVETKQIASALGTRIDREERELYPLPD